MAEKTVESQERQERLAAALRENLKKRKNRARALTDEGTPSPMQPSIETAKSTPPAPK